MANSNVYTVEPDARPLYVDLSVIKVVFLHNGVNNALFLNLRRHVRRFDKLSTNTLSLEYGYLRRLYSCLHMAGSSVRTLDFLLTTANFSTEDTVNFMRMSMTISSGIRSRNTG